MKRMLAILLLLIPAALIAQAQPAADDTEFRKLLDDEWQWGLREFPTLATSIGDNRYNDRMVDNSEEAIERRRAHARELVGRIRAIDRTKLSAANQLNYDLFLREAEEEVAGQKFRSDYIQLTQRGGIHSQLANLVQQVPRGTAKDYDNFLKRLEETPRLVDQSIAQMRKGLAAGITPPRITLRDAAELINNHIKDDPTQ